MALTINITDGCGLSNEARCELVEKEQSNTVLAFLFSRLTSCTLLTRRAFQFYKRA